MKQVLNPEHAAKVLNMFHDIDKQHQSVVMQKQ
jgi:hypothetical protein